MGWSVYDYWKAIAELRPNEQVCDGNFANETQLNFELRINPSDLELDGYTFSVGFSKVVLQLECQGVKVALGQRYGELNPTEPPRQITVEEETKGSIAVKADSKMEVSKALIPSASGSASAEANRSQTQKVQSSFSQTFQAVVAQTNDRWLVTSPSKDRGLYGTYLSSDTPLCTITPNAGANWKEIRAHLSAHKSDLVLDVIDAPVSWFKGPASEQKNKKRILEILIAKSLAKGESSQSVTRVKLSYLQSYADDE